MYLNRDFRQESTVSLASSAINGDAEPWVRSNDQYPYTCSLGGHSAGDPHDGLLNSVTGEKACQPCVLLLHDIAPSLVGCADSNTMISGPIVKTSAVPSTENSRSKMSDMASGPRHASQQPAHVAGGCDAVTRTHHPTSSTKSKRSQNSLTDRDKDGGHGHSASCYKQRAHAKLNLFDSSSRRNRRSRRSSGAHTDPKGRSQNALRSTRPTTSRENVASMQGHLGIMSDRTASKAAVSNHSTQTSPLEARINADSFLSKLESELLCKATSATCLGSSPRSSSTPLSKKAPSCPSPTSPANEQGLDETGVVTDDKSEDTSLCQSNVSSEGFKASTEREYLQLRMRSLADEIWLLRSGFSRR